MQNRFWCSFFIIKKREDFFTQKVHFLFKVIFCKYFCFSLVYILDHFVFLCNSYCVCILVCIGICICICICVCFLYLYLHLAKSWDWVVVAAAIRRPSLVDHFDRGRFITHVARCQMNQRKHLSIGLDWDFLGLLRWHGS